MRWLLCLSVSLLLWCGRVNSAEESRRPNIVIIYTDDVGYGDLSCYGGKVLTPHLDKLAAQGIKFTNAHTTSATCTPSRYALLTGEYPWRNNTTSSIIAGDARAIITPEKSTIASVLKNHGYRTSVIGKWHLGLGDTKTAKLDWNGVISNTPIDIGFDECFIIPATGDRVPCVYVENNRVANLDANDPLTVDYQKNIGKEPTGKNNPEMLKMKWSHGHNNSIVNGISRIGFMSGGKSALWNDETMADDLAARAIKFITQNKAQPFFLYFATHDIHVPRVAHSRFLNQSDHGLRGDVILQLDDTVGKIMQTLSDLGIANDTLIIFSSDNGPVMDDGYEENSAEKLGEHQPAGILRGGKYSAFEAGTRVPFIVNYPARIAGGKTSPALFSQIDLFATLAKLGNAAIPENAAPDSLEKLTTLLGENMADREFVIEQAANNTLSYIWREWKYIEPSKGNPHGGATIALNQPIETGYNQQPQLYNLRDDRGERKNMASENPELVKRLAELLQQTRSANK